MTDSGKAKLNLESGVHYFATRFANSGKTAASDTRCPVRFRWSPAFGRRFGPVHRLKPGLQQHFLGGKYRDGVGTGGFGKGGGE
jgi:hypothetical protein